MLNELLRSAHSVNWSIFERKYGDKFKILLDKLAGKNLVDVGSGDSDYILNLARRAGVAAYMGIDLKHKSRPIINNNEKFVTSSAEVFLSDKKNLVSGDYNFALNGLDEVSYEGDAENLCFLVAQILGKGGILFGVGSNLIREIFKNNPLFEKSFKVLHEDDFYFIFEKM